MAQHGVAMLGKNGLGVKLHAFNVVLAMPQPHDGLLLTVLVLCPGGHLEALRQRCGIHHKAVIARGCKRAGQPPEDADTVMVDGTGLTMHHPFRSHDIATKNRADALLPKANTKYRQLTGEVLNNRHRYARLSRGARARGDTNTRGRFLRYLSERNLVITAHFDFGAQLPEVLHDVPGKGVVVVDH